MANNIKTPEAILSYVQGLFEPTSAVEGGEAKYSVTLVFEDGADLTELKQAALAQAKERWGDKLAGAEMRVLETPHGPANFLVAGDLRIRLPWRDAPEDVAKKNYPEGSTFINVRNSTPPGIVSTIPAEPGTSTPARIVNQNGDVRMADGTVVPGARPVYSGCHGIALLSVFDYNAGGNMGVSFGLQGVQVRGDGDRLDGRANVEDVFDADEDSVADLSDLQSEGGEEDEEAAVGGGGDDLADLIGS